MLLFLKIFAAIFVAEMGDKTQLLMVAMTSRYKMRDICIGSACSILALNAIAVTLGAFISELIPPFIIKFAAAIAFLYFACSSLKKEDDEEEETEHKSLGHPILTVFATFFIAEFGDKTQLTAITFAANEGAGKALMVCLACSAGLFVADIIGMMVGHVIKEHTSGGFLNKLAFVLFLVFGIMTGAEAVSLIL